jgi:hypothetical protein
MPFDPMLDIPKTDEEVKAALAVGKSKLGATACWGLYRVYRQQGNDLLEAYKKVLELYVKMFDKQEVF